MSAPQHATRHAGASGLAATTDDDRFAHHRWMFGQVPHFIVVVTSDGTVLDASPEVTQWLGWSTDEFIHRSAFEFIHPGDHELVAVELIREMSEPNQPSPSLVVRVLKSDNTWCDIEILGKNHLDDPLVNGVVVSARYVSGPCLSQRVLAAGDYLYQSVATTPSDGTTIFDAEGRRVYTSSSLCAMLGYSAAELRALGPGELMFPSDMRQWRSTTRTALQSTEGVSRLECRVVKKDGSPLWIEVTVVNLLNQSGVNGIVAHIRDIHERKSLQEELMRRASVDELTGLANRAAFVERLVQMEQLGERRTLLFCDLDGFKSVNDVLGHTAGDQLLHAIGVGLRAALGDAMLVARMGGDEFCIVMPATTEVDSTQCAHTVIATVNQAACALFGDMLDIGPLALPIGVSVGVAIDALDLSNTTSLLSRADHAMYSSKRLGPNRVTVAE